VGNGCCGALAPSSLSDAQRLQLGTLLARTVKVLQIYICQRSPLSLCRQVADAEELYRLKGVRNLVRIASAATVLGHIRLANGERALALFTYCGSALETDWQADLGGSIEGSISSFAITSEML